MSVCCHQAYNKGDDWFEATLGGPMVYTGALYAGPDVPDVGRVPIFREWQALLDENERNPLM